MRPGLARQLADLKQAVKAVNTSDGPARVALLLRDSRPLRTMLAEPRVAQVASRLISLKAGSPIFMIPDDFTSSNAEVKGSHPIWNCVIILVQNKKAPDFNPDLLLKCLPEDPQGHMEVHPGNWALPPRGQDADEDGIVTPTLAPRYHPLTRPSQTWYRADHVFTPPKVDGQHDSDNGLSNGDRVDPHLGLLGVTPVGLQNHIAANTESWQGSVKRRDKVADLILKTSLTLFSRDEVYKKWRKKR